MSIDPTSYDQAIDDADKALSDIQANVSGPMPEATWLSLARSTVAKLRTQPASVEVDMNIQQEARLTALESHVMDLTKVVSAIKSALEGANPTVQTAMEAVPPVPKGPAPEPQYPKPEA